MIRDNYFRSFLTDLKLQYHKSVVQVTKHLQEKDHRTLAAVIDSIDISTALDPKGDGSFSLTISYSDEDKAVAEQFKFPTEIQLDRSNITEIGFATKGKHSLGKWRIIQQIPDEDGLPEQEFMFYLVLEKFYF